MIRWRGPTSSHARICRQPKPYPPSFPRLGRHTNHIAPHHVPAQRKKTSCDNPNMPTTCTSHHNSPDTAAHINSNPKKTSATRTCTRALDPSFAALPCRTLKTQLFIPVPPDQRHKNPQQLHPHLNTHTLLSDGTNRNSRHPRKQSQPKKGACEPR